MYSWVILPLLIFVARILDVSIGTIRVIFISRGFKFLAPILGFFEVLIWLAAVRQILVKIPNFFGYVAYAGGFAAGTFVGIYIEDKLSMGKVIVRVITRRKSTRLLDALKKKGYVVTSIKEESPDGKVDVVFTVIRRQDAHDTVDIIKKFNPQAFYSIEDVRFASEKRRFLKQGRRRKSMFGFCSKAK